MAPTKVAAAALACEEKGLGLGVSRVREHYCQGIDAMTVDDTITISVLMKQRPLMTRRLLIMRRRPATAPRLMTTSSMATIATITRLLLLPVSHDQPDIDSSLHNLVNQLCRDIPRIGEIGVPDWPSLQRDMRGHTQTIASYRLCRASQCAIAVVTCWHRSLDQSSRPQDLLICAKQRPTPCCTTISMLSKPEPKHHEGKQLSETHTP
jgi:hypothetical protein